MATAKKTLAVPNAKEIPDSVDPNKRNAILKATIAVIAEQGYHRMDVQEVADRAKVGKGTVYRYFTNKESLFWSTAIWLGNEIHGKIVKAIPPDGDCKTKLMKAIEAKAAYYEENPEAIAVFAWQRAMFQNEFPPEVLAEKKKQSFEPLLSIVREGIEKKEFEVENVFLFVYTLISLAGGATQNYRQINGVKGLADHVKAACGPVLDALLKTP